MKYLKTFESYSVQPIDEAFLGALRPNAVIKEILADLNKAKKNLDGKFKDYAASFGDRMDVAISNAPTVHKFLKGEIGAEEVKPEEVAKVVMQAKSVIQHDNGDWEDVGKRGGIPGGTGAESGGGGSVRINKDKDKK
jgi:hypothetical protein